MKERLKKFIQSRTFDPSTIGDDLALKTEWKVMHRGGTNFRTHKLEQDHLNLAVFRPTIQVKLFTLLFYGVGIAIFIFWYRSIYEPGMEMEAENLIPAFMAVLFPGIATVFYFLKSKSVFFDKLTGSYWTGRGSKPDQHSDSKSMAGGASLDEIYALQLLKTYSRNKTRGSHGRGTRNRGHFVYELNLVLNDSSRYHVVAHGSEKKMKEDAEKLSEFLEVPVWDAT